MDFNLDNVSDIIPFPVGLKIDNCVLLGAKKNDDGDVLIGFEYRPSNTSDPKYGAKLTHREFNPENNTNLSITEEKKEKSWKLQSSRINHILGRLMSSEDAKNGVKQGEGSGWTKFSNNVINLINSKKNTPCSLKVIYNKQNYPSLPAVPDFISTEAFPKDFSANPDWDFFEKRRTEATSMITSVNTGVTEQAQVKATEDVF